MTLSQLSNSLPALTPDGRARQVAMNSVMVDIAPTSVVGYQSAGKVLIIGSEQDVVKAKHQLSNAGLQCHVLVPRNSERNQDEPAKVKGDRYCDSYELTGHLGQFQAISITQDQRLNLGLDVGLDSGYFDLVLEYADRPAITAEIPPPGYYWIGRDTDRSRRNQEVLQEIPEMIGSFQKPKFFNYDPDICAHSRSNIVACTRCIDACPTDAISSIIERVEVNSHLCQGGGTCATACPTGAMTYAYPTVVNLAEILRQLLHHYRDANGATPTLLFHDREHGKALIESWVTTMPENLLPIEVEEVGALGLDVCLCALAYGASSIKIVLTPKTPKSVRRELQEQLEILHALLSSLGQPEKVVTLLDEPFTEEQLHSNTATLFDLHPASFASVGIKRTDIRAALEHLHDHAPAQPQAATLPRHAPFGAIQVDTNTCTLCMGCVAVCPATALETGGEAPQLNFIEHNCVQCGLCETACPEGSISRYQRYLYDTDDRMRSRTMNADAPFHCRRCGKPFATTAMLNRMKEKLQDHWMFTENKEAMERLEMCEDCRVKDMFAAEAGMPRDKI